MVLTPLVIFLTLAALVLYGTHLLRASWLFWQDSFWN